ncbi:DUF7471 family protein [Halorientalis salina]|jgi:hypothetical protein|uniref:DUF7471 family protein n=1 Tax=Halorientalis salina TaxID=2932266 RepID=UPI00277B4B5D|nr:hypothetical protein [Halorientalis salina]
MSMLPAAPSLHAVPPGATAVALPVVLALAGLGSSVLIGLALAALARRRSWSYLLVTLALATLLARTAVAVLTMNAVIADETHHLLEHGLDVAMAALVVAAVYTARTARGSPPEETYE